MHLCPTNRPRRCQAQFLPLKYVVDLRNGTPCDNVCRLFHSIHRFVIFELFHGRTPKHMHGEQFDHRFIHIEDCTPCCKSRDADNNCGTAHIERARVIRFDLDFPLHMEEPRYTLLQSASERLRVKFAKDRLLTCRRLTDHVECIYQIGFRHRLL